MNKCIIEDGFIICNCIHCTGTIIIKISEINCTIFRHGVFKHNNEQINPHLPKEACEELIKNKSIFGCAKPFRIIINNNEYFIENCDYI